MIKWLISTYPFNNPSTNAYLKMNNSHKKTVVFALAYPEIRILNTLSFT